MIYNWNRKHHLPKLLLAAALGAHKKAQQQARLFVSYC
jgi:hypothetical protein